MTKCEISFNANGYVIPVIEQFMICYIIMFFFELFVFWVKKRLCTVLELMTTF